MSAHVGMHRLHAGGGGSHLCAGAPVRVAGGRRQISWYVWMEKPVGTEERVPAVTGLTYSALTPQSKPSRARSRPGQVYINRAGEPRRLDTGTTHLPARPSGYERYDKVGTPGKCPLPRNARQCSFRTRSLAREAHAHRPRPVRAPRDSRRAETLSLQAGSTVASICRSLPPCGFSARLCSSSACAPRLCCSSTHTRC